MSDSIYKRELKKWSRKSREQKFEFFSSVFQTSTGRPGA